MSGIRRNAPCPCNSGKKYKHCHGHWSRKAGQTRPVPPEVLQALREHQALEVRRQEQQGLGRPIISLDVQDQRIVAVGNRLLFSKDWKTFPDFLSHYITKVMGADWGNPELAKPYAERHPLLQWYHHLCLQQQKHAGKPGEVFETPSTGATQAYLHLAYNLYLLEHNASLQALLIKRLKNRDQFYPAYYETFVAAAFIRGGFDIELEDESDEGVTHCEFTATHRVSRNRYSIEAKARSLTVATNEGNPKPGLKVGRQLFRALKKRADHTRVVFIDLNLPSVGDEKDELALLKEAAEMVHGEEASMTINGVPAPPAYVFLTNYPYHHALESADVHFAALIEGFKIPEMRLWERPHTLREAVEARDKHTEIADLLDVLRQQSIPSTFDGQSPAAAFHGADENRIVIGRDYEFVNEGGDPIVGQVEDAILAKSEKATYIIVKTREGRRVILTAAVSDAEIAEYNQSPSTYFGVRKEVSKVDPSPLEFYDVLMSSYKDTTKEKLLEFMQGAPNIDHLRELPQPALARLYCERMTEVMMQRSAEDRTRLAKKDAAPD